MDEVVFQRKPSKSPLKSRHKRIRQSLGGKSHTYVIESDEFLQVISSQHKMENETLLEVPNSTIGNGSGFEVALDCPQFSNETAAAIETFAYWVEGVLLCVIAVPGIAGNALSSYILVKYFICIVNTGGGGGGAPKGEGEGG
jgi:hypothetical protein